LVEQYYRDSAHHQSCGSHDQNQQQDSSVFAQFRYPLKKTHVPKIFGSAAISR
jgi:hypothetical protein